MMKKTRPELLEKMGEAMFEYVGECNKRNPTGEEGFNQLHLKYGYAHMPISEVNFISSPSNNSNDKMRRKHLFKRLKEMDDEVPQHYMFGSRSWIEPESANPVLTHFANSTTLTMIQGAGHHIYAENPDEFNYAVTSYL